MIQTHFVMRFSVWWLLQFAFCTSIIDGQIVYNFEKGQRITFLSLGEKDPLTSILVNPLSKGNINFLSRFLLDYSLLPIYNLIK